MLTALKDAITRLNVQTYMRGRNPYIGDRVPLGVPTYLYEGYAGANVGDEIVYETVRGLLSPSHPVFCGRFRPPLETIKCWAGKSRPSAVVFGGGTVRPLHVLRDPRFRQYRLPFFSFGLGDRVAGSGEMQTYALERDEKWRCFLDQVDVKMFGVRGPRSLMRFRKVWPDAVMTGDTALAAFDVIENRTCEFIGINIGRHFVDLSARQLNMYADVIEALGSLGMPLVLIPLHATDLSCIRAVLSLPKRSWPKKMTVFDYVPSPLQFRSMISHMAMGVGERLHFSIPLFASGVPSVMLAYADKHHDFAESINAEDHVVTLDAGGADVVTAIGKNDQSRSFALKDRTVSAISDLKQALLKHFETARGFIARQDAHA